MKRIISSTVVASALVASMTSVAYAQVPPDIHAGLVKIGRIVDTACTARLYRPLMPKNDITSGVTPLYPGHTITRDVSFGPHPKDVVDIMVADEGPALRPVLIYVPGGTGEKIEISDKAANAFYDNISRWANKNGMVAVIMQRHQGKEWDDPAKDVSAMIQWVQANIAKYKGDASRMFIGAHSAGVNPVGTYLGHPELHGKNGVGVKGAFLMSGQFNALPIQGYQNPNPPATPFAGSGESCGGGTPNSDAGALPGRAMGQPGGPHTKPLPPAPPVDAATQLSRSSLPGIIKSPVKIMLISAELDTGGVDGDISPFFQGLRDALCKAGPDRCPTTLFAKQHSHISEVFAFDTPDTTVSAPILKWINSIK